MKNLSKHSPAILIVVSLCQFYRVAVAQHSDIELGYVGEKIHITTGSNGPVFEGDFATSGVFQQFTSNPGFATNGDEGLLARELDVIDFNVLGPLRYHNGRQFSAVPSDANITIGDNPAGLGLLVIDAHTAGPISGPGAIGQVEGGGSLHSHIRYELNPRSLDTADFGAYGLLLELTTSDTNVANSDPFYIVFNFGLDEPSFGQALNDFASQVPEPASWSLAILCLLGMGTRRVGWSSRHFESAQREPTARGSIPNKPT